MKKLLLITALVASAAVAQAQSFLSNMNGAQDGGGARQGIGTVNLTLSGTTLTLLGSFSGLSANVSAAHIHGPAAVGVNTGVIYGLGGTVIPLGATSGAINGSVSLAPIGAYTVANQIADLNNSLWYINIHNSTFPGGEIRGQIVPVPEPSVVALSMMGLGALWVWKRRRVS